MTNLAEVVLIFKDYFLIFFNLKELFAMKNIQYYINKKI